MASFNPSSPMGPRMRIVETVAVAVAVAGVCCLTLGFDTAEDDDDQPPLASQLPAYHSCLA